MHVIKSAKIAHFHGLNDERTLAPCKEVSRESFEFGWRESQYVFFSAFFFLSHFFSGKHWKSWIRRQITLSLTKKAFPPISRSNEKHFRNHNTAPGVKHLLSYRIFESKICWMGDSHYLNDFWCRFDWRAPNAPHTKDECKNKKLKSVSNSIFRCIFEWYTRVLNK